jgi:hypothetical protein
MSNTDASFFCFLVCVQRGLHFAPRLDQFALRRKEVQEEFYAMLEEQDKQDEEIILLLGMLALYTDHHEKYCNRAEYRVPKVSGLEWVQEKLGSAYSCYTQFRMTPPLFMKLHHMLTTEYGLKDTSKSTSLEALGMFLWMLGGPESYRKVEDKFERSLGTVHAMFYRVMKCVIKFADDVLRPRDPEFTTMHPRVMSSRFFPDFKDCIGAIDGSHIHCIVPQDKFTQHMNRKGTTTQNVMAACDFDMFFTFVLAGWPGSVHDMRVFDDAMTQDFPHPPEVIHLYMQLQLAFLIHIHKSYRDLVLLL